MLAVSGLSQWHLIVDLSSPGGASVNDSISPDEFTLPYISVDQITRIVLQFGRGAVMAKFDMEAIKRNIAVQPLPVGYAVALKVLHWFGSPLWSSLRASYF